MHTVHGKDLSLQTGLIRALRNKRNFWTVLPIDSAVYAYDLLSLLQRYG